MKEMFFFFDTLYRRDRDRDGNAEPTVTSFVTRHL